FCPKYQIPGWETMEAELMPVLEERESFFFLQQRYVNDIMYEIVYTVSGAD
ncbi:unnamed protein product, partial [Staurois parvus]